jgi:hypothetical protein
MLGIFHRHLSGVRSLSTLLLAIAFAAVPGAAAQQAGDTLPTPVPVQIAGAKKVFISNAGEDGIAPGLYGHERDFPYSQFYAGIKSWGRFELTATPAEADVILEIKLTVALGAGPVTKGDTVGSDFDPQIRLRIIDAKTQVVLWGFVDHITVARLKGNRQKDFEQALAKLLDETKSLVNQPASAGTSPK